MLPLLFSLEDRLLLADSKECVEDLSSKISSVWLSSSMGILSLVVYLDKLDDEFVME